MACWGRRKEGKIGRGCREKKEVETVCKEGWGRELCKCLCVCVWISLSVSLYILYRARSLSLCIFCSSLSVHLPLHFCSGWCFQSGSEVSLIWEDERWRIGSEDTDCLEAERTLSDPRELSLKQSLMWLDREMGEKKGAIFLLAQ